MHHARVPAARAKELLVAAPRLAAGHRRRSRSRQWLRCRRHPAADPLRALLALRELPARLVVGLMSGTSADGTDAALCEMSGSGETTRVKLLGLRQPSRSPGPLRERIFALAEADASELSRAGRPASARASPRPPHAVCSQGGRAARRRGAPRRLARPDRQPTAPARPGKLGATLQIGEAAVIAERTGLPVISDFRVRDVAAGGEGAPAGAAGRSPAAARAPARWRAIQNIGGIANVTLVGGALDDLVAFDNGPGNMALDAVARAASRGVGEPTTSTAARAARGRVDAALLAELHRHPYLALPPPKSTGRELFGRGFVYPLLDRWKTRSAVGRPAARAARRSAGHPDPLHRRGHRPQLPRAPARLPRRGLPVRRRRPQPHAGAATCASCAPPPRSQDTGALGLDPDAKEAIAFAVLANETLFGRPGNVPRATGAVGPRVLGKITL